MTHPCLSYGDDMKSEPETWELVAFAIVALLLFPKHLLAHARSLKRIRVTNSPDKSDSNPQWESSQRVGSLMWRTLPVLSVPPVPSCSNLKITEA